MERRLELQSKLRELAPKAWYQKPPDNKMTYPCFVYKSIEPKLIWANNRGYIAIPGYEVVYITDREDDEIMMQMVEEFSFCHIGRKYVADNLYHYPFELYY